MRSGFCTLAFLGLCLPAFAQLDSATLRAKFGQPANRETFHHAAGFDLVVDYGADHQVCQLEVPQLMPTDAKISNLDEMRKRMDEFLLELVPDSVRGKELFRGMSSAGAISVSIIDYEHVSISAVQSANDVFPKDPTRVMFKTPGCQAAMAKAGR